MAQLDGVKTTMAHPDGDPGAETYAGKVAGLARATPGVYSVVSVYHA